MHRNTRKISMTITLLTLILLAAGCASTPVAPKKTAIPVSTPEASPPGTLTPPIGTAIPSDLEPYTTGMGGLRLDLSAVIQAIYYRLTGSGSNAMGPVRFADGVGPLTDGSRGSFDGFALGGVSVRVDRAASEDPSHRRVEAVLKLADALGRQAYVAAAADYLIGDERLLVRQAVVIPHHPGFSDIRFLVVPANRLPSLRSLKRLPLDEVYRIVSENAMDREGLARLKGDETGRYKLAAFNMVRGKAEDRLKIYISGEKTARRATGRDRISLNENGWSAVVVDGSFQFNAMPAYTFHVGVDRGGAVMSLGRFQSVIRR